MGVGGEERRAHKVFKVGAHKVLFGCRHTKFFPGTREGENGGCAFLGARGAPNLLSGIPRSFLPIYSSSSSSTKPAQVEATILRRSKVMAS